MRISSDTTGKLKITFKFVNLPSEASKDKTLQNFTDWYLCVGGHKLFLRNTSIYEELHDFADHIVICFQQKN